MEICLNTYLHNAHFIFSFFVRTVKIQLKKTSLKKLYEAILFIKYIKTEKRCYCGIIFSFVNTEKQLRDISKERFLRANIHKLL